MTVANTFSYVLLMKVGSRKYRLLGNVRRDNLLTKYRNVAYCVITAVLCVSGRKY